MCLAQGFMYAIGSNRREISVDSFIKVYLTYNWETEIQVEACKTHTEVEKPPSLPFQYQN